MPAKKTKKSTKAKVEVAVVEIENPTDNDMVSLTELDLLSRLSEKLSTFDAEMILEAAMLSAGVARKTSENSKECFKKKEARNICLALIKRGGPAFSVGTMVYREVLG